MLTADPTRISVRPHPPKAAPPASATGVFEEARSEPSKPCETTCTAAYKSATNPMASSTARGTVRAGSFTSPLGTNAASTPRKAKMSTIEARPTSLAAGACCQARFAGRIANAPATASSARGSSFATVAIVLNRLAPRTPRTFNDANAARMRSITAPFAIGAESEGTGAASESAKTLVTAASANVSPDHNSTPVKNPMNGPNATSTYAYGPPVSATRLPASAKQRTISPIAIAQTRYANGAAAPRDPATVDGRRKIPAPTVTFTIPAARLQVP